MYSQSLGSQVNRNLETFEQLSTVSKVHQGSPGFTTVPSRQNLRHTQTCTITSQTLSLELLVHEHIVYDTLTLRVSERESERGRHAVSNTPLCRNMPMLKALQPGHSGMCLCNMCIIAIMSLEAIDNAHSMKATAGYALKHCSTACGHSQTMQLSYPLCPSNARQPIFALSTASTGLAKGLVSMSAGLSFPGTWMTASCLYWTLSRRNWTWSSMCLV
jgi:hypothetical protein